MSVVAAVRWLLSCSLFFACLQLSPSHPSIVACLVGWLPLFVNASVSSIISPELALSFIHPSNRATRRGQNKRHKHLKAPLALCLIANHPVQYIYIYIYEQCNSSLIHRSTYVELRKVNVWSYILIHYWTTKRRTLRNPRLCTLSSWHSSESSQIQMLIKIQSIKIQSKPLSFGHNNNASDHCSSLIRFNSSILI